MDDVKMRLRPSGEIVRVYAIYENGNAYIWSSQLFDKCDHGWKLVELDNLVPIEESLYNENTTTNMKAIEAAKQIVDIVGYE